MENDFDIKRISSPFTELIKVDKQFRDAAVKLSRESALSKGFDLNYVF